MPRSFDEVCTFLATTGAGFTLWVGAGSSIAVTSGASPSWDPLISNIARSVGRRVLVPSEADFPTKLECVSESVGHATFRKELRAQLVDAITPAKIDVANALHQAVIGCRAGALVSFNIDIITGYVISMMSGGAKFTPRTLYERSGFSISAEAEVGPGPIGKPVYYPHGLLFEGNVVMTKSEYDRHVGSLAMETAVHLCIGTDLVILGMSLDDRYLREAILQNRRWVRDVFWINSDFSHSEWARVAHVTCVSADHSVMWAKLADAIVDADSSGWFQKTIDHFEPGILRRLDQICGTASEHERRIQKAADSLVSQPLAKKSDFEKFARFCVDCGFEVPAIVASDSRFLS